MRRVLVVLLLLAAAGNQSSALQRAADAAPAELRIGFARPGGGYTIQTIPLETYIARVLAGEAARDSPPAALEALAITIRTFTLVQSGSPPRRRLRSVRRNALPGGPDGDGGDDPRGAGDRRSGADLQRQHRGGLLQRVVRRPHRDSVQRLAESRKLAVPAVQRMTMRARERRPGRRVSPNPICCARSTPPGSAASACAMCAFIRETAPSASPGWRSTGSNHRKSPARICASSSAGRLAGSTSRARRSSCARTGSSYIFTGHGYGHGVGMCVIGSTNLAARGVNASTILARYFPGAAITALGDRASDGRARVERRRRNASTGAGRHSGDAARRRRRRSRGDCAAGAGRARRAGGDARCPGAGQVEHPFPHHDRRLRAGDRPVVVHVGGLGQRRDSLDAGGRAPEWRLCWSGLSGAPSCTR